MYVTTHKGISLVEVVIGVAIAGLVIVFVSHTLTLFFASSEETLNRTQALYLAEEGQEILRYVRDEDWDTIGTDLSVGTTYYFYVSDTEIGTTTAPETVGDFARSFVLSNVARDNTTDDDIVFSGGTNDAGSRFATTTVSWGSDSVSLFSLLTNIHGI